MDEHGAERQRKYQLDVDARTNGRLFSGNKRTITYMHKSTCSGNRVNMINRMAYS